MFNNFNNNQQGNSINVNTRLYTSYSDESLLTLSAWNTNLSLRLQPAKGKNDDGITVYSSEQTETVVASISPESNQVLLAGIDNDIIPAIEKSEPASIAVITGANAEKRKIINIITDGKKIGLSVVFGGTINLNGTSSGSSVINHTFNERSYYTNYKKDEGGDSKNIPSVGDGLTLGTTNIFDELTFNNKK